MPPQDIFFFYERERWNTSLKKSQCRENRSCQRGYVIFLCVLDIKKLIEVRRSHREACWLTWAGRDISFFHFCIKWKLKLDEELQLEISGHRCQERFCAKPVHRRKYHAGGGNTVADRKRSVQQQKAMLAIIIWLLQCTESCCTTGPSLIRTAASYKNNHNISWCWMISLGGGGGTFSSMTGSSHSLCVSRPPVKPAVSL